ncbi:MAG: hypothetical protein WD249_07610 [Gaiellaceae bacterium]
MRRDDVYPSAEEITADNGSDWFISGAPHPRWSNERLRALKRVQGSNFEVVAPTR